MSRRWTDAVLYPVYVHAGDADHAYAATFPDFPGCFAAADGLAALPAAVQEAVEAHFHGEGAAAVPAPVSLELLAQDDQYRGGVWMMVDLDLRRIADTAAPLTDEDGEIREFGRADLAGFRPAHEALPPEVLEVLGMRRRE